MRTRALVGLACAWAMVVWLPAQGAERPTSEAIRAAAAAVGPAVVRVEVARGQRGGQQIPDFRIWPPGEVVPQPRGPQRWEWQWPPRGDQGDLRDWLRQMPIVGGPTRGAGLIVAVEGDRGLVAVPAALAARHREATVHLADGRRLQGKVLGRDELTGTACIEIQAPNLTAAKAPKQAPRVGDWLLAVGPPPGRAVAIGIVSAIGRPGAGAMAATAMLVSDVRLADDMAGCPLVTLGGEVVAMTVPQGNAWRRAETLTAAVPVATVQATAAALARDGRVRRAFLGITYRQVEQAERERLGIEGGVEVMNVVPGQPAAQAGMQAGDVIVELAGEKVDHVGFRAMVAARKPGEKVAIKVLRGGEERFVEVTLGEQEGEAPPRVRPAPKAPQPPRPQAGGGQKVGIGLSLQPLTAELAEAFGYQGDTGLLVTAVEPDSPAAKGRPHAVSQGDLVKEIARRRVATVPEARQALAEAAKAKAKSLLILTRGRAGTRYIVVDLPR